MQNQHEVKPGGSNTSTDKNGANQKALAAKLKAMQALQALEETLERNPKEEQQSSQSSDYHSVLGSFCGC